MASRAKTKSKGQKKIRSKVTSGNDMKSSKVQDISISNTPENTATSEFPKDNGISVSWMIQEFKSRTDLKILALIFILATFLRVYQLGMECIWLDEATSILISEKDLFEIIRTTKSDVHPAFYYIVLHFMTWFGQSEFMVRVPSMIFGILSIPFMYLVSKRLFGVKEGLISSFLLSISLMHIYYSQEARMYSLLAFLVLASIYFFYSAVEENRTWLWLGFIISTVLGIYTHYFGFFIFPIEILFYALTQISINGGSALNIKFKDLRNVKLFGASTAIIIFLIIPRIQVFIDQAASRVGGEVTWGIGQSNFVGILLARFSTFSMTPSTTFLLLFIIGIVASIIHNKKQMLLLGMWFVLPIIVSYYLAALMPIQPRYLIFILPAFLILISRGVTATAGLLSPTNGLSKTKLHAAQKNQSFIILGIILLFCVISFNPIQNYYTTSQKNDWRSTADYLESRTQPGDVIVPLPGYMGKPLEYYYDNSTDGTSIIGVANTPEALDEIVANTKPNKVYFVMTGDINAADPRGNVIGWLQNNARLETTITGIYILST